VVKRSQARSSAAERWVLAVTGLASFLVSLDALVVSTALPAVRVDLQASLGQLEWTINAYVLTFAVLLMTAAALGDRFGRRRLFAAGLALFAAASVACALAPNVGWLIAGRALQGAGAAFVLPLALALLGVAFPPERRGWAIGVYVSLTGISVLAGPLVGGAIVEGISWPWIFWINLPIAVGLIPFALKRVEESHGPNAALDLPGLTLLTASTLGIVWALVRGNSASWASAEVLATLGAGLALLVAFVAWELRATEPMLAPALFRTRAFSAGNVAAFFSWASDLGMLFFMAQFLQTGLGYGPFATGLRLMPWGATTALAPRLVGRLIGRFGERPFVAGGFALSAACLAYVAAVAQPELPYWQLVAPLVLSGTGFALAITGIQTAVIGAVSPQQVGKASGTFTMLRQLGGVFGVAVLAAVFAATGGYHSPQTFTDGFAPAMLAAAALALAGAVAGLMIPPRRVPLPEMTQTASSSVAVQVLEGAARAP
jgi:EmrB/QacA subfamily drug resistance transporter